MFLPVLKVSNKKAPAYLWTMYTQAKILRGRTRSSPAGTPSSCADSATAENAFTTVFIVEPMGLYAGEELTQTALLWKIQIMPWEH